MSRKVNDTFSWRIAKAKNLLTETDIDRLACVGLLCINTVNYDKAVAADELGAASVDSFRVAISKLKKKLREGGATHNPDGELPQVFNESATESVCEPATPNKSGKRKRKANNSDNGEEEVKRSKETPNRKTKMEQDDDKTLGVEEQTEA